MKMNFLSYGYVIKIYKIIQSIQLFSYDNLASVNPITFIEINNLGLLDLLESVWMGGLQHNYL